MPGVFELNLRDERYLPFEGAGVILDLEPDAASAAPVRLRFHRRRDPDVALHRQRRRRPPTWDCAGDAVANFVKAMQGEETGGSSVGLYRAAGPVRRLCHRVGARGRAVLQTLLAPRRCQEEASACGR